MRLDLFKHRDGGVAVGFVFFHCQYTEASALEADPRKPEFILTVWGVGYKFNDGLLAAGAERQATP